MERAIICHRCKSSYHARSKERAIVLHMICIYDDHISCTLHEERALI